MKFSNVLALGLATLAVASPVEKKDLSSLDSTASEIISNVESLLEKIVTDVETLASAAGVDPSSILTTSGISLAKRDNAKSDAGSDADVKNAATALITDVVGELVTLSTTTGVSLIGSILSALNL